MRKIVILKHGGGELANQLWNFISVYAWSLKANATIKNPSFFEYHGHFNFLENESWPIKILAKLFADYRGRKQNTWKRLWRGLYSWYPRLITLVAGKKIISSQNITNKVTYLPPTSHLIQEKVNLDKEKTVYMTGWLFRNPRGLQKYNREIKEVFAPRPDILNKVNNIIGECRKKYSNIIGIHIRQWDYRTFKGGRYFIEQKRIRRIVDQYLGQANLDPTKTLLLVMSDGPIESEQFKGLNFRISQENAVTDLFLLSKTDAIIGSDSSFGHFASWYGDIPHIVISNEEIDWDYYKGKKNYFENKFCTMVHF